MFAVKVSSCIILAIAILNFPALVFGNDIKLDINQRRSEEPFSDHQQCQEGKSFVWCVPLNYNKYHEPWWDIDITPSTFPWLFEFLFQVREIQAISDQEQTFKLSLHLELTWKEPRLTVNDSATEWADKTFGREGEVNAPSGTFDYLWHPDLYISQLRKYETRTAVADLSGVRIGQTKHVTYHAFVDITVGCLMSFDNYPFDTHSCTFKMGSYNHPKATAKCNSSYNYDT